MWRLSCFFTPRVASNGVYIYHNRNGSATQHRKKKNRIFNNILDIRQEKQDKQRFF